MEPTETPDTPVETTPAPEAAAPETPAPEAPAPETPAPESAEPVSYTQEQLEQAVAERLAAAQAEREAAIAEARQQLEQELTAKHQQELTAANRRAALAGKVSNVERVLRLMEDVEQYFEGSEPKLEAILAAFPEYAPKPDVAPVEGANGGAAPIDLEKAVASKDRAAINAAFDAALQNGKR